MPNSEFLEWLAAVPKRNIPPDNKQKGVLTVSKTYAFKVLSVDGKKLASARAEGQAKHVFKLGTVTNPKKRFSKHGLTCFTNYPDAQAFAKKQSEKNPNIAAGHSLVIAVVEVSGQMKAPTPCYLRDLKNGKFTPRRVSYKFPAGTVFYRNVKPLILL